MGGGAGSGEEVSVFSFLRNAKGERRRLAEERRRRTRPVAAAVAVCRRRRGVNIINAQGERREGKGG